MDTIINYIATWIPSLTSIVGIVMVVISTLKKVDDMSNRFKNDTTINDIEAAMKKIADQNEKIKQKNLELVYQNDLLIDELKKIKNYRGNMRK